MDIDYRLMYVTDDRISDDHQFFSVLEQALIGGVTIVQLREKSLDSKHFYQRAVKVKELCNGYAVPLIINDRLDIALAVDAAGIHIGQKDIPHYVARKLLGKEKIIGLSVSTLKQSYDTLTADVDYIGLSPLFNTATKKKDLDPPLELEGLRSIRKVVQKPIVSIGGINLANVEHALRAGSDGIAVVSAISQSANSEKTCQQFKQKICQIGIP